MTEQESIVDQPWSMKLRRRLLVPLFLAFSLFLCVFVITLSTYHFNGISKLAIEQNETSVHIFRELIVVHADFMAEALEILEHDGLLKYHLDNLDRDALQKELMPHFNRMKKDHGITHFYFSGPDRVNLLRLHQPKRYGDVINRHTTIRAQEKGGLYYGIELGPLGTFTLRVVMPWYIDNRLIGFVELGQEIEHIIDAIKNMTRTEVAVLIDKKFINKDGWLAGMKMLGRSNEWFSMQSYVPVYQKDATKWKNLDKVVTDLESLKPGKLVDFDLDGRNYLAAFSNLLDASQQRVGYLMLINDVTDANQAAIRATVINGAVGVSLVILLMLFFYLLADRAEKRLESSRKLLIEEMKKRIDIQEDHAVEMEDLALHDPMTGLPNQNFFYIEVGKFIQSSKSKKKGFAVLVINIRRFREIVDTMGYKTGDMVLKELHDRLKEELKGVDIIARVMSNLIGVCLCSVDREGLPAVVQQISKCIDSPFKTEEFELHIEGGIGVSFYPEHGQEASLLIQRADVANRMAKDVHSSFAIYDAESDPYSKERLVFMTDLRRSIDDGDLRLYYQPKVDVKSGKVSGVEALVRWEHPRDGFQEAGKFVPMAERTGLVHPLTAWVFNEAICQQRRWQDEGLDLKVSVNVSAHVLRNPRFPQRVRELLDNNGVEPSRLIVEITESAIMADPQDAAEMLSILDGMGVAISIDDFGTGYSSLSYLSRLPVSELKIDKSFVEGMTENNNDVIIVRSTVDLGRNLGLKVVAEGVENQAEWDQLTSLGCDMVQGFYISKPKPSEDLKAWLTTSKQTDSQFWKKGA